ncbi:MAG: copper resistance protein CopC [Microbacteriaceae bacterium]|nr:MAG: copper resistance protein CopC [Microbacteriaceae bacterium]
MRRALRALAAAAGVAAAGLALVLVTPPAAEAHSAYVTSTPETGAVLDELPPEFSVTMNETLLSSAGDAAFALRVLGPGGLYYGDGCLRIVDRTVATDAAIGPAGEYVLEWQVVSADGHPVSGVVPFTWTGEATEEGRTSPAVCGEPSTPEQGASGHHDDDGAAEVPLGDAVWIVAAVLVIAVAVTVTLIVTRRR